MIGTYPVADLAPLDYRYVLDAAMSSLADKQAPAVRCNVAELIDEVDQRIPAQTAIGTASAGLWVEPLLDTWQADLAAFRDTLQAGAPLVIVASRPLARMLPERRWWKGHPLCLQLGGCGRLRRALAHEGFGLVASYGIHSAVAIGLNILSAQAERWGLPDLADRLHFAARLRYRSAGPLAAFSTVALLIARKKGG